MPELKAIFLKEGVEMGDGTLFMGDAMARLFKFWPHETADCVITSCRDGKHGEKSYHYSGRAFDLRTRDIPQKDQAPIHAALKELMGKDYDVILEKDHIHIEPSPGSWLLSEVGRKMDLFKEKP